MPRFSASVRYALNTLFALYDTFHLLASHIITKYTLHDTVAFGFILDQKNLALYHALKSLYSGLVLGIFVNVIFPVGMLRLYFFTKAGTTCQKVRGVVLFDIVLSVVGVCFSGIVIVSAVGVFFSGIFLSVGDVVVGLSTVSVGVVFSTGSAGATAVGIVSSVCNLVGNSVKNDTPVGDHKKAHPAHKTIAIPNIFEIILFHVLEMP